MVNMSDHPLISAPIARDLVCVRCDYNLRGLPPDSNCPECGHPIPDSLTDDQRRGQTYPKWVERTHRRLAPVTTFSNIICMNAPVFFNVPRNLDSVLSPLALLCYGAVCILCTWMVLSRRLSAFETPADRRCLRAIGSISAALALALMLPMAGHLLGKSLFHVAAVLIIPTFMAQIWIAQTWCASLAHRLLIPRHARYFAFLAWAIPANLAFGAVQFLLQAQFKPYAHWVWWSFFGANFFLCGWSAILGIDLQNRLKHAILSAGPYPHD